MKGILNKFKALKHNNKFISTLQLICLGVIIFLAFDQSVLNEIRYILELFNVKEAEKVMSHLLVLYKAVFDASNIYTVVSLIAKILLSFITFIALILLFFEAIERYFEKKKQENYSAETIITANYKAVYLKQSKFLC